MRAGIRLAIFGPPNVGKSSLLNFLGTVLPSRIDADIAICADKKKEQLGARLRSSPTCRARRAIS